MTVSSMQVNTQTFFEPREHSAACQCSGCCKKNSALDSALKGTGPDAKEGAQADNDPSQEKETNDLAKLSSSDRQQVMALQQRDSEVRSHEAAHIAAGGSVVSGAASFTYQKGPDGKLYAVGGEVAISSSGGNTPEEKIAIARQIQAGALAPANPSPQDLKVASSASVMEAQARRELSLEANEELKEKAINTYDDNQNNIGKANPNILIQA